MDNSDTSQLRTDIERGAARCVKCGKCLSVCPTYQTALNEAESPRGRISLMQGLCEEKLSLSPALEQHLDQCLACRNCEAVCPAEVPYGQLIDETRELINQTAPSSPSRTLPGWLIKLVESRGRRRQLRKALKAFHFSQMPKLLWRLVPHFSLFAPLQRRSDLLLPKIRLRRAAPPKEQAEAVMLFSSCVSECLDMTTTDAAKRILQTLHYEVIEPEIKCCGALFRHNGQFAKADEMAKQCLSACDNEKTNTLLTLASGCGAQIKEYPQQLGQPSVKIEVADICHWLLHNERFLQISLKPYPKNIWLHQPCTLRNGLQTADSTGKILAKIPEMNIKPLPTLGCCGASGLHLLNNPDFSKQFLKPLAKALTKDRPSVIVSSNIGCAMHLQRYLRETGFHIPVMHPITLIWNQMQEKNF